MRLARDPESALKSLTEPSRLAASGFVATMIVQILGMAILLIFSLLSLFVYDACGSNGGCSYGVGEATGPIVTVSAVAVLVGVFALASARSRRSKSIWWLPLAGLAVYAAITLAFILANSEIALGTYLGVFQ